MPKRLIADVYHSNNSSRSSNLNNADMRTLFWGIKLTLKEVKQQPGPANLARKSIIMKTYKGGWEVRTKIGPKDFKIRIFLEQRICGHWGFDWRPIIKYFELEIFSSQTILIIFCKSLLISVPKCRSSIKNSEEMSGSSLSRCRGNISRLERIQSRPAGPS